MSKTKAKTASKNNPVTREQAREYFYQGQKIKPVKLITETSTFFAAEYDSSGDLVVDSKGQPMTWSSAKQAN